MDVQDNSDAHRPCMGIRMNILESAKAHRHLKHYLEGGGVNGYDAMRHENILFGAACKLGKCAIISFLPDKIAQFLDEYQITDSRG